MYGGSSGVYMPERAAGVRGVKSYLCHVREDGKRGYVKCTQVTLFLKFASCGCRDFIINLTQLRRRSILLSAPLPPNGDFAARPNECRNLRTSRSK